MKTLHKMLLVASLLLGVATVTAKPTTGTITCSGSTEGCKVTCQAPKNGTCKIEWSKEHSNNYTGIKNYNGTATDGTLVVDFPAG